MRRPKRRASPPQQHSRSSHWATGWTIQGIWRREICLSSSKHPGRLWGHSVSYSTCSELFYPGIKREGRVVDHTHLHPMPTLCAHKPLLLPDPVTVQSKAYVRGRCTGIGGSNLTEGMDVRLACLLCRQRPLRRADRSFRGVVLCECVLLWVTQKSPQWGGLNLSWVAQPNHKNLCSYTSWCKQGELFLYFADRASQYIYLNINQLDALNIVLSQSVHGTATNRCDDTRGCIVQFWPPDDEHFCAPDGHL